MRIKGVQIYGDWSIINEWRECLKQHTVCEKRIMLEMMRLIAAIRIHGFYYNAQN